MGYVLGSEPHPVGGPGVNSRPVIVIFGCAVKRSGEPSRMLRQRIDAAAAFGRTLSDPLFLPTGGIGRNPPSEAEVMARVLVRDHGVNDVSIRLETTARDTLMSVRAVAAMLGGHDGPVFAMSSGFHQPRCVALLRIAGVDAHACPPPPASPRIWKRWYWRLREAAALPYDLTLIVSLRLLGRV